MRRAVTLLTLIAAVVAEAPYHLPRPAPNSPQFNYLPVIAAPPPPPPPQPIPRPQPQPNYIQNPGYHYQQPSILPAFVQPAPQPQIQPQPQPIYIQPAPQPLPNYQPIPYPIYQTAPQPQPAPFPQISYGLPQPQIAPRPIQPLPAYIPPQPQPQPQPLPQPQLLPQPLPQPIPQPQPQPAPLPNIYYQPQLANSQQGYSYPQPPPQIQYATPRLPLQSQPLTSSTGVSSLSSYQADSNQYNTGLQSQVHNDALDSVVVDRVQNIIKENEHSTARNAGYLSLVSGVSLENAKPSIELSSFVQNSPISSGQSESISSSSSASSEKSGPITSYGLPTITANSQSSQTDSLSFLPQTKPAVSYGSPN